MTYKFFKLKFLQKAVYIVFQNMEQLWLNNISEEVKYLDNHQAITKNDVPLIHFSTHKNANLDWIGGSSARLRVEPLQRTATHNVHKRTYSGIS